MDSKVLPQNNNKQFTSQINSLFFDLIVFLEAFALYLYRFFGNILSLNILVIILFFTCLFIQYYRRNYACLLFFCVFFLFLLDKVFLGLFSNVYKYPFLGEDIERHVLSALGTSILGIYSGVFISDVLFKKQSDSKSAKVIPVSQEMKLFLRNTSIFFCSFDLINILAKVLFVRQTSYLSYYTDYETPLPYIFLWFANVAPLVFYFFLGSLPKKKDALIPIALYLFCGVTALFFGQRNVLVVRAILVFTYLLIRNRYNSYQEVWISKKNIFIIVILLPFMIAFMSFWRSYRSGEQEEANTTMIERIIAGLQEQGNNISILDFEYRYRAVLPKKMYALGGLIAFLHNNAISHLFGIEQVPTQMHTIETAEKGYSFEAALMYEENPGGYLAGYGIGSCFIAELLNSFGFLGVFIGSVLYGLVFQQLEKIQNHDFLANGILLIMFQLILISPRSVFIGFISVNFQLANIFIFALFYYLNYYMWPAEKNEKCPNRFD